MEPETESNSLRDTSVIIVEDDYLLAKSLDYLLSSVGCRVVGMAPTVDAAVELVTRLRSDVAILDVNLRGSSVAPVAELLRARGDAFVFLTGYGDLSLLPDHLRAYPHVEKPLDPDVLFAVIRSRTGRR